jgi:hypothetical protein
MPLNEHAKLLWGPQTLKGQHSWTAGQGIGKIDRGVVEYDVGDVAQDATVNLEMTVAGYVQPVNQANPDQGDECYVVVDLANTTVTPGLLVKNDDSNRGWYTHSIVVRMSFKSPSLYAVDVDSPQSSAATGSGSSSNTSSIGFFGDQLTGSLSSTDGGSRSYEDFEVTNLTTHGKGNEVVNHQLALKLSDAGAYTAPFSLVNDHQLAGLVPRAAGNLPLTSAAAFVATLPTKKRPEPATLEVNFHHAVALVVWQSPGSWGTEVDDPNNFDMGGDWQCYPALTGSWEGLAQSSDSGWSFVVDFENGKVNQR